MWAVFSVVVTALVVNSIQYCSENWLMWAVFSVVVTALVMNSIKYCSDSTGYEQYLVLQ